MALPIDTVLSYTPREVYLYVKGYQERNEQQSRETWTMHRMYTAVLLAPHSKKPVKPTDIITFPWEKTKVKKISDKELRAALRKIKDTQLWPKQ